MSEYTIQFTDSISGDTFDFSMGQIATMPKKDAMQYIKANLAIRVGSEGEAKQIIVDLNNQVDELKAEIENAEHEQSESIETLSKEKQDLEDKVFEQRGAIQKLKFSNDQLKAENLDLAGKVAEIAAQLAKVEKEKADLLHSEIEDFEGDEDQAENEDEVEEVAKITPKIETKADGTKVKAMPRKKAQPKAK